MNVNYVERKNSEEKSQEKFDKISCNNDSNNFCSVLLKAFFYNVLYKYPGCFERLKFYFSYGADSEMHGHFHFRLFICLLFSFVPDPWLSTRFP